MWSLPLYDDSNFRLYLHGAPASRQRVVVLEQAPPRRQAHTRLFTSTIPPSDVDLFLVRASRRSSSTSKGLIEAVKAPRLNEE